MRKSSTEAIAEFDDQEVRRRDGATVGTAFHIFDLVRFQDLLQIQLYFMTWVKWLPDLCRADEPFLNEKETETERPLFFFSSISGGGEGGYSGRSARRGR